ncbi:hypothetical protein ESCO_003305 [Escovopsis weberi]|uniref:Uncharacterized protein n=1 Tax=Escovopsis weberi TaxID=150374 RepID=A0A0M9VSF5_ESCWE|nr:hypothetical protein ESCO_003305 [Escovopsis weberi]
MEHAWLDSLEEDWVSQPPTIASAAQLPSLSSMLKNRSPSPSQSPRPSRIPRRLQGPGAKLSSPSPPPIPSPSPTPNPNPNLNTSLSILGEQTPSDINIARQRVASQWARGHKASGSRALSQTLSDDSNGSVVRHSKGLRSPSADDRFDTPEWKRRLVYGDVQYGEHVDLFSSAATGLQDMFRPPEPSESRERYNQAAYHDNSTMPSSPPIPRGLPDDGDLQEILDDEEADEDDDEVDQELLNPDQVTPSPSPRRRQRQVRYKLNDGGGGGDDDDNEDSIGVSFLSNGSLHPPPAKNRPRQPSYRQSSALSIPLGSEIGSRKPSDARHELFSPILLGRHDDEDGKVDFAPLEMPAEELHKRLERLRLSQIYVDGSSDPSIYISQPAREPIFRVEDFEGFGQSGAILSIGRRGGSQRPFAQRSASPEMEFSTMLPEESIQAIL